MKWIILGALILYVVSPFDLAPGPVDDIIAILIYMLANRRHPALYVSDDEDHGDTDLPL